MKFLNTIWGSWLKVFAAALLVQYLKSGSSIFSIDWKGLQNLIDAGLVAVIPVIINYINKSDTRYGIGKE